MWLYFSIIVTLFYARIFTNRACYGRNWDKPFLGSKKKYYAIYASWFSFWMILCLAVGSGAELDHTFDPVWDFYYLYSGRSNDEQVDGVIYDDESNHEQSNFTSTYRIRKNEKDLSGRIDEIVNYMREPLGRDPLEVVYKSGGLTYSICQRGELIGEATVKTTLFFKEVSIYWDKEKGDRLDSLRKVEPIDSLDPEYPDF